MGSGKKAEAARTSKKSKALERAAAEFADVATETDESGHVRKRDYSYTQNRELSWLMFDNRVMDEAFDPEVPLFERLKFCEIFDSNLEEWFMIRVGGLSDLATLKNQPKDNKSHKTPAGQLDAIFEALPPLVERHAAGFAQVEAELREKGLVRLGGSELSEEDMAQLSRYFEAHLAPIISPMVVDPRHPFPNLRSGRLYVACALDGLPEPDALGIIEVPASEQRVVALGSGTRAFRYVLLEDVLRLFLDRCFGDYAPSRSCVLRVTRNADIDPDDEGVE